MKEVARLAAPIGLLAASWLTGCVNHESAFGLSRSIRIGVEQMAQNQEALCDSYIAFSKAMEARENEILRSEYEARAIRQREALATRALALKADFDKRAAALVEKDFPEKLQSLYLTRTDDYLGKFDVEMAKLKRNYESFPNDWDAREKYLNAQLQRLAEERSLEKGRILLERNFSQAVEAARLKFHGEVDSFVAIGSEKLIQLSALWAASMELGDDGTGPKLVDYSPLFHELEAIKSKARGDFDAVNESVSAIERYLDRPKSWEIVSAAAVGELKLQAEGLVSRASSKLLDGFSGELNKLKAGSDVFFQSGMTKMDAVFTSLVDGVAGHLEAKAASLEVAGKSGGSI